MKHYSIIFFSIISFLNIHFAFGQIPTPEQPTFKLFLIGDAGESDSSRATLKQLKAKLESNPNSAVIFLGDNCYTGALHGFFRYNVGGYDGSKLAGDRLMGQLNILRNYKGFAYFIPGNHDWFNTTNLKRGKRKLLNEEKFIEDTLKTFTSLKNNNETFLPTNGSPGPISKDFNEGRTRVIFIDTYRLIVEEAHKGKHQDTAMLNTFYTELKKQLQDASDKKEKIIVVAHHPIYAKGKHSLPLTFFQSMIKRYADTNTNYPPYNRMAIKLDSLLKSHHHPDVYYVAGHEHSLEYFFTDSLHYLVSGAGCKVDNVNQESCNNAGLCLQWGQQGFFEVAFYGRYEAVLMYHRKSEDADLKIDCLIGCP